MFSAAPVFALVCALAAAMAAPAAARKPAAADAKIAARIDAFLAPLFEADAPGATVIVTRDGAPIFRKAYGMADVEAGRAMRPDDVMRLASVTKQLTAAAIMLLVEDGKLRLDDDFTVHLPDYPKPAQTITIDQLLTHTSGIPGYTELPGFGLAMGVDATPAQMIERFNRLPLQFAPGTRMRYNNSAYFLLGAIIERVSGKPYADFMAERVFEPLGMRDTAYEGHERHGRTRVQGYRQIERDGRPAFVPALRVSMTQPFSAGALVSTVDDLARWDAAIAAGRLLKPESWRLLHTPIAVPTGNAARVARGWFVSELQGREIVHHNGGIHGFNTDALRVPAERLYAAVLMNAESGRPSATALNRHIAAGLQSRRQAVLSARFDERLGHVDADAAGRCGHLPRRNRAGARRASVQDRLGRLGDDRFRCRRTGADGARRAGAIDDGRRQSELRRGRSRYLSFHPGRRQSAAADAAHRTLSVGAPIGTQRRPMRWEASLPSR
jgi:CubicO group peptidase (beta-lactamase class C family)